MSDGLVFNKLDGYYGQEHDSWNPMSGESVFILLRKGISQAEFQKKLDVYPFSFETENPDYKEYLFISSINKMDEGMIDCCNRYLSDWESRFYFVLFL
ncbi:hypothetical protein FACS1894160_4130 [Bacteroidia bacterium]|nr:hypothetical protein FACS1894123_00120 [Bacteroidia bacterium]GHV08966.1 hypothetical protein FACS1894160_4130 [Bacteroidia bacterium]